MARRRPIQQDVIVRRFADKLRELRLARGMTQVELARAAHVATSYAGRLERGQQAPGLDLLARLAAALGVPATELVPVADPPDPLDVLRTQARRLLDDLLRTADRETLQLVVPFLARVGGGPAAGR